MSQSSHKTALWIVLAAAVLTSLVHCPLLEIFDYDKELFRYMGMAIVKGQVPYRDFFDHKPPLIYFVNALAYLGGSWGIFLISSSLSLLAALWFLRLCRSRQLPYPWMLPVLFLVLLRIPIISMGMGLTREYTTIFILMGSCALLGEGRYRYFLCGALLALTFSMQQDQVLLLAPLLAYDTWKDRFRGLPQKILQLSAGALLVLLPMIGYFYANQALDALWRDAFVFNTQWYAETPPLKEMLRFLFVALGAGGLLLPLGTAVLLGIFLFRAQRQQLLLCCAFLMLALSPGSYFISGRPIMYYMQPFAATLPLFLWVLLRDWQPRTSVARQGQHWYLPVLIILVLAGEYLPRNEQRNDFWIAKSPEYQFLKEQQLKDGELYVFCETRYVFLYNEFRILAPSRWLYHHFWFWYPAWDKDGALLKEITRDLLQRHTRYIIDCSDNRPAFMATPHHARWKQFLQAYYTPQQYLLSNRKGILWKLK